jgi:hypothetical protein
MDTRLYILLAVFGASPAWAGGLDTCREEPARPGERKWSCKGFRAQLSVEQPAYGAPALLDPAEKVMRDGGAKPVRTQVDVAGTLRTAVSYTGGIMVMLPGSGDTVRVAACEESTTGRCAAALPALAVEARKAAAPAVSGAPVFAGQVLPLAANCKFNISGPRSTLACASAGVSWVEMAADDPPAIELLSAGLKKALASKGSVRDATRACHLDGVAARCWDAEVTQPDGTLLTVTFGEARVRGKRMMVQCNATTRAPRPALPSPCAELMSLP